MSNDIVSAIRLDKESLDGKILLIKELNGCESNFVLSCVLSHEIRNKSGVCLLALHCGLDHYHSVGLKLGYNLKNHITNGTIQFIDVASILSNNISIDGANDKFINILYDNIERAVVELKEKCDTVTIMFDDLSHLLDVLISIKEINRLLNRVFEVFLNGDDSKCSMIVNTHVACSGDESDVLAGVVSHKAYTVVEVAPLKTGRSAEVSGNLTVKHPAHKFTNRAGAFPMNCVIELFHFRLFDRGVKLFAPGAV